MSDGSGPQKIAVLESNVREMKVELSYTRAQMEQMMGMMQQLLQTKSADEGQQNEESDGTGREDVNVESDGAEGAVRTRRC